MAVLTCGALLRDVGMTFVTESPTKIPKDLVRMAILTNFATPDTTILKALQSEMEKTIWAMTITDGRLRQTFCEGGAMEIYLEVKAGGDFLGFARRYAFSPDCRVARNALWGLTKAGKEDLAQLQVMLDDLINQAMTAEDSSVRRLTLNVVERLEMTADDLRTDFLDFCFERMMDVEEFPGIQAVCMKLAFRMCKFYPELMDELRRALEAMEADYYKPAVRCVRSSILRGKFSVKTATRSPLNNRGSERPAALRQT